MLCKSFLFNLFKQQLLTKNQKWVVCSRLMSNYPIDDQVFGLNEEQRQVCFCWFYFLIFLVEGDSLKNFSKRVGTFC